jgi:hypothetical protein
MAEIQSNSRTRSSSISKTFIHAFSEELPSSSVLPFSQVWVSSSLLPLVVVETPRYLPPDQQPEH